MGNKTSILVIIGFMAIIFSSVNEQIILKSNDSVETIERPSLLVNSDAIVIRNDESFVQFPGNGTLEKPYRIENLRIRTLFSNGIYIVGTSKYFIIQNCDINVGDGWNGIYLSFVSEGTARIVNNTIIRSDIGIEIEYSEKSFINNNTIYACQSTGIKLTSSPYSEVQNNVIEKNGYTGVFLDVSHSSQIINNKILENNNFGIYLVYSPSSTIFANNFTNDGLFFREDEVEFFSTYNVSSNIVNNQPLGYFTNLHDEVISESHGQLILINCTSVEIRNQNQVSSDIGCSMLYCKDSEIYNSTFSENDVAGIYLEFSSTILVHNCTLNNNEIAGFYIISSHHILVSQNTVSYNHNGIIFEISSFSTISHNTFENNINHGVIMGQFTESNKIYSNDFLANNRLGNSQAYDEGINNVWYDKSTNTGNYWSDYNGEGNYLIDGTSQKNDPYPNNQSGTSTEKTNVMITVVISSMILLGTIKRKGIGTMGKN